MSDLLAVLEYDFMRRALFAALVVGLAAPLVGVFVVQRGLSLIGDGLGHVALAGVAAGVLTGTAPVWTALATAVGAALLIEFLRRGGRTGGDAALAVVFYGGIAVGVLLMSLAPAGSTTDLEGYLFGALTTTSPTDVRVFAVLAVVLLVAMALWRPWFFAFSLDEEHSRASGLPTRTLSTALAVLTAVTVVLSMRTVGLLLFSALMVLPVVAAQHVSRSFAALCRIAGALGAVASVSGVLGSAAVGTPPGATIVLLVLLALAVCAVLGRFTRPGPPTGSGRAARALRPRAPRG
ncbi:metal ABC transporter permease [Kineococcus gypseus]|uniref:metal ABC transporter permease n=1 Tax=Kineococcus gypseus TaxID=1637102 RepID=UPI003D7CF559